MHLISLGCAKNQVDSERILARLVGSGALICESPEDADAIVVNTCGFIAPAQEESLQAILDAADYKQRGTCRRLVVVGCLVERRGGELRRLVPGVDAFVGVGDEGAVVRACGLRPCGGPAARLRFGLRHVAYLRIADGCNNRCAYCTIPAIRGPFRSRPAPEVESEAVELAADGARELILIAQDTTSYGRDLDGVRLSGLIERLAVAVGDRWLRLMYAHPAHFTDELIEAYRRVPCLCPYVDLPLQHLADPVLRRMGRKVTQGQVLALIDALRARVPGVALRTTFIVGFPGETEGHFAELLGLVERIGFDHLGAFTYSREPGTPAARMRPQVPQRVKEERLHALMTLQQSIARRRNRARIGETVEVIVDASLHDGRLAARTRGQAPDVDGITLVSHADASPGDIIRVRVTGAQGYDLTAAPCRERPAKP